MKLVLSVKTPRLNRHQLGGSGLKFSRVLGEYVESTNEHLVVPVLPHRKLLLLGGNLVETGSNLVETDSNLVETDSNLVETHSNLVKPNPDLV